MMRTEVTFNHATFTEGTFRGDWFGYVRLGAPSLISCVGQQGCSKQQEQERVWQVPLAHVTVGAVEIQRVTITDLGIYSPNEEFCWLPPGDIRTPA